MISSRHNLIPHLRWLTVLLASIFTCAVVTAAPATASTSVTVQHGGICSAPYYVPHDGLYFKLGTHKAMKLRLAAVYSWAWKRDIRGQTIPAIAKNQYHVHFYDGAGRVVWREYNSIPNGGGRTYYVGSNVKKIKVTAGIGLDRYGRPYRWAVRPAVGYTTYLR